MKYRGFAALIFILLFFVIGSMFVFCDKNFLMPIIALLSVPVLIVGCVIQYGFRKLNSKGQLSNAVKWCLLLIYSVYVIIVYCVTWGKGWFVIMNVLL